jgi:hypothetical protein
MKRIAIVLLLLLQTQQVFCWGFYAHRKINYFAVFLLPPEMMVLFKPQIDFLSEHAVDPDKRRYIIPEEGARHFIDIDHYGLHPFDTLPKYWNPAVERFSADTLNKYGIVPWWLQTMLNRLTQAFRDKDQIRILKYAAELGHYISDAHVPLHTNSNHNGQFTDQKGIHAFWESRIPELMAEKEWDFYIGKAEYLKDPASFIWKRVRESAIAADSVLTLEKQLSEKYIPDQRFAFEERNSVVVKQYSTAYSMAYNKLLNGMIERRMRQSIFAVASLWYTAWINAGQPDLAGLSHKEFNDIEKDELEQLNKGWKTGAILGRSE